MTYCSKYPPRIDTSVQQNIYTFNGSTTIYGTTPAQTLQYRWYSSVKTPGFKSMKPRDYPANRFTAGAVVYSYASGYASRPYQNSRQTWSGRAPVFFPTISGLLGTGFATSDSVGVMNRAQQQALSKCSNMKINIAQSFAERKQTANLLIHSVNRLVSFAVLIKKRNFREANNLLRSRQKYFSQDNFKKRHFNGVTKDTFANSWLEYSYGWRPLLNDIYGAAELLAQLHTKTRPTKVSGRAIDIFPYSASATSYGVTAKITGDMQKMAQCQILFDIASYEADMLKSTGISNPALLAWELLPYSFVVDWFVPVGNYLTNLNAASGLRFLKGHTSVKTAWKGVSKHVSNSQGYSISGYDCTEQGVILERFPLTGFPSALLPSFKYDLNLSQVTSGIALLSQLFRR